MEFSRWIWKEWLRLTCLWCKTRSKQQVLQTKSPKFTISKEAGTTGSSPKTKTRHWRTATSSLAKLLGWEKIGRAFSSSKRMTSRELWWISKTTSPSCKRWIFSIIHCSWLLKNYPNRKLSSLNKKCFRDSWPSIADTVTSRLVEIMFTTSPSLTISPNSISTKRWSQSIRSIWRP